ncbi:MULTISPECIES: YceI family protein [Thalassospira]|jgi:polyisoprenoid-binding protein YceI|uniref:Polyisoprenoid-binding protein n=1 Tax=Thalassospira xiamenensis TaxID=220697 RepID=A0ABR5Y6F1_9PROT|nr:MULTISPECIES: YceI family protein [Thalassospira]MAL28124.1 YceI family protein [Thalassospira sp.]MBR9781578.1 YceI family protein [Rhodospirillales bacterium]KZD06879.1 polyisoprenoid-binding protein [Thalassospira xiamenensis]KZD09167.1 polyisoprenoid-binding protein [Thalassospira xiamenensis]MBL4839299.1 YceI family protein [Thalassospira sp.]|tara:strand:+ start:2299 stop:2871 length:573 start_codon:yes stop_codon:yes gene_type:complete
MTSLFKNILRASVIVPAIAVWVPAFAADTWQVKADDSDIKFSGTQLGADFEGAFDKFTAEIVFSPDDLAGSKVSVLIDIASVDTENADRDSQIISADWFDVAQWPTARFETKSFREIGPGQYEAVADLTIRDVTKEVVLPFNLEIEGNEADAEGTLVIKRTDFGVGQGQWSDTSQVGDEVTIRIDIDATR